MKKLFFSTLLVGVGSLYSPVGVMALGMSVSSAVQLMAPEAENEDIDAALNQYQFPERNQYPIVFSQSTENGWYLWNNNFYQKSSNTPAGILTATVEVDQDATFTFSIGPSSFKQNTELMTVKVDGEIYASGVFTHRYFIELTKGKHTVEWISDTEGLENGVYDIAVEKTPVIEVSLLEPGSLGTEVLYHVNKITDVRKLVVKGAMNDDDWAKIGMMKENLYTLDLSEATISAIPDNMFAGKKFIHSVKLPQGLKTIGAGAFSDTPIEELYIPETVQSIGSRAFQNSFIKKINLPESMKVIPYGLFARCSFLEPFKLPSALEEIESDAFSSCNFFNVELPSTLRRIGAYAFHDTGTKKTSERLVIPDGVTEIGTGAFMGTNYQYVEVPVNLNILPNSVFSDMKQLQTLRLKSPTVVENDRDIFDRDLQQTLTLQIPSYLVTAYKLDDYWYNVKAIEGFSTEEVSEWTINADLVLGAHDRMLGTPSVNIASNASLKINGEDGMPLNNLNIKSDPYNKEYGRMYTNCDGVTVEGKLSVDYNLRYIYNPSWHFISLPFDMKVSDMNWIDTRASKAVRYYDGKNRATNGASGSWKNYGADDVIPAGTGFIMQVSEPGWWNMPSMDNESKQYMTSYKMFVKQLEANPSENAADNGWNLVGNPYQCWYNIHRLNFIAPITVNNDGRYEAYSIIDDDYAIAPNQAFFVQCPESVSEISFPLEGRQMTSVIESQNAAPSRTPRVTDRQLMDFTVSDGENTDRTRVVMNSEATMGYDAVCDAAKFMAEVGVPQIYTYDSKGNKYAINERPEGNGVVKMGFVADKDGVFTIALTRNDAGQVMLTDLETGAVVDLMQQDYSFSAGAGTYDNRFEVYAKKTVTGIDGAVAQASNNVRTVWGGIMASGNVKVYALDGKMVAESTCDGEQYVALPKGCYIVKTGGRSVKVTVAY
ncbi:MAG: leucine-rich repeat domain-containing protein [Prevotella sp.]|nr:leucine-rich repeat domain-containing protein [Prevotella sp.]